MQEQVEFLQTSAGLRNINGVMWCGSTCPFIPGLSSPARPTPSLLPIGKRGAPSRYAHISDGSPRNSGLNHLSSFLVLESTSIYAYRLLLKVYTEDLHARSNLEA